MGFVSHLESLSLSLLSYICVCMCVYRQMYVHEYGDRCNPWVWFLWYHLSCDLREGLSLIQLD